MMLFRSEAPDPLQFDKTGAFEYNYHGIHCLPDGLIYFLKGLNIKTLE